MAIRRPSLYSPSWLYQDFLYAENPPEQLRYLQVKWDRTPFERVSHSFDYSDPPYSDGDQRGGPIVAQIDYTLNGKVITIDSWETNWRDEWPLRAAVNYLTNCMYPAVRGYVVQVPDEAHAFWVSEGFVPITNEPFNYLFK